MVLIGWLYYAIEYLIFIIHEAIAIVVDLYEVEKESTCRYRQVDSYKLFIFQFMNNKTDYCAHNCW